MSPKMKVICMIQARMGSSRLPGKVLAKIKGKPILEHIVDFLRHSKYTNKIVIATTDHKEDDSIEDLAKKMEIPCYRGSFDDPLGRFYNCAKIFKPDIIVRITGDNPLIDPEIVDKVIQICIENKSEYASNMINQTYPLGYLVEAITFSLLENLHKNKKDPLNREHIVWDIRENPQNYKISEIFAPKHMRRPEWRLSVDYIEDLELIKKIFDKLLKPSKYISYQSVFDLLENNPEILKINKKWS